jgi:hypothetical protein
MSVVGDINGASAKAAMFGFAALRASAPDHAIERQAIHPDSVVLLAEREVDATEKTVRQRVVLKSGIELLGDAEKNSVRVAFLTTQAPPAVLRVACAFAGMPPRTLQNTRLDVLPNGNFVLEDSSRVQVVAGNGEYDLRDKVGGGEILVNPLCATGTDYAQMRPDGTAVFSYRNGPSVVTPFLTSAQIYGSVSPDHSAAPGLFQPQ